MKISTSSLVFALALGGLAAPAPADDLGQEVFGQYCATCHGEGGAGDGPLAELMTTTVTDLTGLAARNDGVFPMLDVLHIIDGRTGLRAHGGPMPVYGAVFDAEADDTGAGPYGAPLYTRGRILSVAYYLESIQK